MKIEKFSIKSQHDGLSLGVSICIPEKPVGILQLVHGMAEHRERYHEFMKYCAQQGLVVMIHDHRGHGASVKSDEDYGYFYQDGVKGVVDDVHQITVYLHERFPDLPLTLFGHSMGSLIVRCYMKQYDSDIDKLVVCGSPSKRVGSGIGKMIARFLQIFQGAKHRSKFVNRLAFGGYNQRSAKLARQNGHKINLEKHYPTPNSWIVSNPAIVAAYDADPRDGFTFTLNGFETLFGLVQCAYSSKGWLVANPQAPIFFISGADDPCLISHKDFEKAVNFMRRIGYQNVHSKLYPGMRHEILNERHKRQVWEDVVNFIR